MRINSGLKHRSSEKAETNSKKRRTAMDSNYITELNEDDAGKIIVEVEEVIEAIKTGEMKGEYFEF